MDKFDVFLLSAAFFYVGLLIGILVQKTDRFTRLETYRMAERVADDRRRNENSTWVSR